MLNTTECTDLRKLYNATRDTGKRVAAHQTDLYNMDPDSQWNEDNQMMWADTAIWYRTIKTKADV